MQVRIKQNIVIVGGGPAGLFCAFHLLQDGHTVDLYEKMPSVGRKFLVAGHGGLNLTHSEAIDHFMTRYRDHEDHFEQMIKGYTSEDLRAWCEDLGVETFIGSSGRVFPIGMKAAEILSLWLKNLKNYTNFTLHTHHELLDFTDKECIFQNKGLKISKEYDCLVLALGGASWEKTGSDGKWKDIVAKNGSDVVSFSSYNCGYEVNWSEFLVEKYGRFPLKNIEIKVGISKSKGELLITEYGIEGSALYFLSGELSDEYKKNNQVQLIIDLKPSLSHEDVLEKIKPKKTKETLSNFLRKKLKIDKKSMALLNELCTKEQMSDPETLARCIKGLVVTLERPRSLSEAISTRGGVSFSGLDKNLKLRDQEIYFIGEMLNFSAPTGGYLLQGCFSTAYHVAQSIIKEN